MRNGRSIVERNLFHLVAGSLLPIIGLVLHRDALFWASVAIASLLLVMELARFTSTSVNAYIFKYIGVLFKEEEAHTITGASYMLIATVGAFFFFEKSLAIMALFFLSIGDPMAALVGSRIGRIRYLGKSLEGSLAFLATSFVVAALFSLTGELNPLWPLLVGAAVAALVEALPLPVDDNLSIPMLAGAVTAMLL